MKIESITPEQAAAKSRVHAMGENGVLGEHEVKLTLDWIAEHPQVSSANLDEMIRNEFFDYHVED